MFEREQEKRENESKAEVEDEYIYGREGEKGIENEDNHEDEDGGGEYENVKEGTNQLSLNLRQHVLLIVPLWCFRLGPDENYL